MPISSMPSGAQVSVRPARLACFAPGRAGGPARPPQVLRDQQHREDREADREALGHRLRADDALEPC